MKAIGEGASMPLLCTGLKDSEALAYCTFGAACSEVELDVLTGEQRVLRCDILFDCGRSINPALDMGQVGRSLLSMYLPVVSHGADNVLRASRDQHALLIRLTLWLQRQSGLLCGQC